MNCISNVDAFVGQGSIQYATDLLREVSDSCILIENMPQVELGDEAMIEYSPAQIEELIVDRGLFLDFGHAVKVAVSLEANYKKSGDWFLKLAPCVFRMSDRSLGMRIIILDTLWDVLKKATQH